MLSKNNYFLKSSSEIINNSSTLSKDILYDEYSSNTFIILIVQDNK